jgi:hypothetical protein
VEKQGLGSKAINDVLLPMTRASLYSGHGIEAKESHGVHPLKGGPFFILSISLYGQHFQYVPVFNNKLKGRCFSTFGANPSRCAVWFEPVLENDLILRDATIGEKDFS